MKDARKLARPFVVVPLALAAILCGAGPALAAPPAPVFTSPEQGAYTSDSEPSFAGTAEDELDPVLVNIYAGPSASGSPVQTLQAPLPPLGGGWSLPADAPLPDGEYTAVAEQTNLLAETSASTPVSFVVDTIGPEVSTDSVASPTADATPTLQGSGGTAAGDEATVTVTLHHGTSIGGTVATSPEEVPVEGGRWSTKAPHLADGAYTIEATQPDRAGNVGEAQPVTFTVDTKAPAVSIEGVGSPGKDSSPTLEGHAGTAEGDQESVTVTLRRGGETVGSPHSVAVAGDGSWSYTTPALEDGSYTAEVAQEDQAGNIGQDSTAFTIDTTAPAPSIDAVPTPSSDATPTLEGAAGTAPGDEGTVTVAVHSGSSVGGAVVASHAASVSGGRWSWTTPALADGTYTAQAVQRDGAGNVGEAKAVTFAVDATPPQASIDAVPSPGRDSTPALKGHAGTAAGDAKSVTVTIYSGASTGGPVVGSPQSVGVSGGAWVTTAPGLADGTYTAQVTQEDEAGETAKASTTFTIDTTAPAPTIQSPSSPTGDPTPALSGGAGTASGDAGSVTVTLRAGTIAGAVVGSPATVPVSAGNWTYTTPHLSDGAYAVQVTQSDQAGNTGEAKAVTFTVNTAVPAVTIAPVQTPSSNSSPTLKGKAGTRAEDSKKVEVTLKRGETPVGPPATVPVTGGGEWSLALSSLPDGTYRAIAAQEDEEGITGEASTTFTIDTAAPALTIDPIAKVGKATTPTLKGSAGTAPGDSPFVTVTVYEKAVGGTPVGPAQETPVSGGGWSYTTPTLAPGTYAAQVVQKDAAGNSSKVSSTTFTVDTEAPEVTLEHPTGKTPEPVARPVFSGKRGNTSGDLSAVTLTVYEGSPPEGKPLVKQVIEAGGSSWSTGAIETPLESGQIYTAIAEQADEAGNVGRSEVAFTVHTLLSPKVTISSQGLVTREGDWFSRPGPTIRGTAGTGPEDGNSVKVYFLREGVTVKTLTAQRNGGEWSLGAVSDLEEGEYLLVAEQAGPHEPGTGHLALTIDGQAPKPAVTVPAGGSSVTGPSLQVIGTAGSAPGDSGAVTVRLYRGTTTTEAPAVNSLTLQRAGNAWSGSFEGVAPGTYTVQAEQADDVGNAGLGTPATFTVGAVPPVASFQWIPAKPHVGETVALVSTSTDPVNPITGFAWDLEGNGTFTPGEGIAHVKFATAGDHVVHLRVTDSVGASATVAETIPVSRTAAALMSPFPIVRIAGTQTAAGARIALLTVQAPLGATVSIACRGKGCPAKSVSLVATLSKKHHSKAGTVLIGFPRFERGLHAGVVLEIRVTRAGQIGKYTRFSVRLGKLPKRVDTCLSPAGVKPIVCPS